MFVSTVNAATIAHLYEVSVPVYSQSKDERNKAITKAFELLLIRITGKRDVLHLPAGRKLLKQSRKYVHSFRYEAVIPPIDLTETFPKVKIEQGQEASLLRFAFTEKPVDPDFDLVSESETQDEVIPTQKILVSFDEQAVKSSLWQHTLPVWGKTRPTTLVWIAAENVDQRTMLNANEMTKMLALLKQQSEERGLPMIYPRLDSSDKAIVNVTDILGSYSDPILEASASYPAEAIVSASFLFDEIEGWQTHWTLYQNDGEVSWRVSASELEIVIFEGIDKLSSVLADKYSQIATLAGDDRFLIYIQNVLSLSDYDKINRYLNAISSIKNAELIQVKGAELIYELELRSTAKALKQAIALGDSLVAQDDPFADDSFSDAANNRLIYRFNP